MKQKLLALFAIVGLISGPVVAASKPVRVLIVAGQSNMEGQGFWTLTKDDKSPQRSGTMLDNTLIVYLSCAGGDHHGGQEDWPFVLVGGMAGKLKMGRYIENPKYRESGHRSIGNLYLSLMQAAGMEAPETFGQLDANLKDLDLTGPLAELMVG